MCADVTDSLSVDRVYHMKSMSILGVSPGWMHLANPKYGYIHMQVVRMCLELWKTVTCKLAALNWVLAPGLS